MPHATSPTSPPAAPPPIEREAWLDWIRVIATLSVVLLHIAARPLHHYGVTDELNWGMAFVWRHLCAVGVPLFFMMSGYVFFIRPTLALRPFLTRRLSAVCIPFLAWSYLWVLYSHGFASSGYTLQDLAKPWIAPAMFHLWFMYPLIALYLATPLLHPLVRGWTPPLTCYALLLWLTLAGGTDMLTRLGFPAFAIPAQMMTAWVGYFVAGYAITRLMTAYRPPPAAYLWGMLAVLLAVMLVFTYTHTSAQIPEPTLMYEVSALPMMLFACLTFALCFHYRAYFPASRMITYLSSRSFVIYLIHPAAMIQYETSLFPNPAAFPFYYLPCMVALVYITCGTVAFTIDRLHLQRLLG
jgi:surface polysaccharide O-acyltransferase-like enzyme